MTVKETQRNRKRFLVWGRLTHPIILLLSIILLVGQWGCATAPKSPPPLLSEQDRARLGTIGVVSARFSPEGSIEAPTSGKGSGTGKGAAMGFLGCVLGGVQAGGYGAALGIFLSPLCAMGGAIYGAIAAESSENVQEAQASLNGLLAGSEIQEAMKDRVLQVAWNRTHHSFVSLGDAGPTFPNEEVSYSSLASEVVDTILEISVAKFGFTGGGINPPLPLVIGVCSRVLTSDDGMELNAHPWVYQSDARKFVEWADDGAQPLRDELERGPQALAGQIVENLFVPVPTSVYVERKEVPALRDRELWCGTRYKASRDFESITGTWSGGIEFAPTSEGSSTMMVTMTIKDDGSYELVTTEQHAGTLRLERGRIEFTVDVDSRAQFVTLILHKRGERQSLEGSSHDGATLWEMTRVQ